MLFSESPSPDESWAASLEGLRRAAHEARIFSPNTLRAYQRTWQRLFAWAGAAGLDPAMLTAQQAARCLEAVVMSGGRVTPAGSQGQVRAALGYAYKCWGRPNPFRGVASTVRTPPPPPQCLSAHDLARLLQHLSDRETGYGEALTSHLAIALFHTCARYSELARLRWSDCLLAASDRIVGLRLPGPGKHGESAVVPVSAVLAATLAEWRAIQEQHRGMKVFAARGLRFCRSPYVFAGPGGEPYTNQSFNAHLKRACEDLRLPFTLTADGLRQSGAVILLHGQNKPLREVQRILRHRNLRTTAKYTLVTREAS